VLRYLSEGWRELKQGRPGRRFRERYERVRAGTGRSALRKWGLIAGGALIVLAGVAMLPLPGPGLPVIAAGTVLIAEESHTAASALDWLESKARNLAGR
jgi:hypothetical protein